MIRLFQSDQIPPLLDALAADVAVWRHRAGPLEQIVIAVPGPAHGASVKGGLAERLGVFANFQLQPLRVLLQETIERWAPGVLLAGPQELSVAILSLLHHPQLINQPEFAPVRTYLDTETPALDDRRLQLALTLGPLFDDYTLHQPGWIQDWRKGRRLPSSPEDRWQAALVRALFAADGPLAPKHPTSAQTHRFWLLSDALRLLENGRTSPVFVFDVPLHSPVLAEALKYLGRSAPVYLYTTNPCLEFWDDVSKKDATKNEWLDTDPPALKLWGRAGREHLRRASIAADWNVEGKLATPPPSFPNLLNTFRQDVRDRAPTQDAAPELYTEDKSIEILEAPGIRRECETIAAEIWQLIETQKDLKWNDFVVVLATEEAAAYRSHLAAAFADAGDLPFHELEVPVASQSRVIDCIRLLLALPDSTYSRNEVLRILAHPTVRARHNLGDTDDWLTWCERLAIYGGADHGDHEGTYIDKDLFNWDQGLRRLSLSTAMAAEGLGRSDPLQLGSNHVMPVDIAIGDILSISRLIALTRSLISDARALNTNNYSLTEWCRYIQILIDTYIGPTDEQDERDLYRVQASIAELQSLNLDPTPLRFRSAAGMILYRLEHLRTHVGQPLAEAIVVAPLDRIASLPFRYTFIPGLGEGFFPASDRPSALDLRREGKKGTGVTPKMRDEYAFLLRILTTQEGVRLSYVAQDPETGDVRPPASTLSELSAILERNYVGEGKLATRSIPLRRHENPGRSPAAQAEHATVILREALRACLPPDSPIPNIFEVHRVLPKDLSKHWLKRLAVHLPPSREGPRIHPRVQFTNLCRFLEEPVQGWARQVLGLSSEDIESDPFAHASEPFETPRLQTQRILQDIFLTWIHDGSPHGELERRYQSTADRLELTGKMPTGVFGQTARRRHLACLEQWSIRTREAMEGRPLNLHRIQLGRSGAPGPACQSFAPLDLGGPQLVGTTQILLDSGGTIALVPGRITSRLPRLRIALRSWLSQLIQSILHENDTTPTDSPTPPWRCFIVDEGEQLYRIDLEPIGSYEARDHLTRLVNDLVTDHHGTQLPFKTQLELFESRVKGVSKNHLEEILATSTSDTYGPLDIRGLPPPTVDKALATIDRRLSLFLSSLRE